MKKRLWPMTAAGLLALALLSSCAPAAPSPGGEASLPPSAAEPTSTPTLTPAPTPTLSMVEATPTPAEPTATPAPTAAPLDFSQEPPLDEYFASIAVPDFLTEEQQRLYKRAHCLYLNLFGVTSANVDRLGRLGVAPRQSESDTVVIDDMTYTVSHGRYRKWAEFDTLVHAAFTDKFWDEHNNSVSAVGEPWVLFREYNGMLCYLETEKGQGYWYNESFPDEFRLEKQTEDEISFTLIGHYSPVWPREGETSGERTARREREYEYTLEFPMRMVLTENGWRFDEFHSGLVDEDDPRGQLIELDKVSYVDRLLGFSMEFPESWRGKLEVEQNYDINQSGRSCIVFYHKPSREVFPGGVLFSIDCCPGVWTEEAPPIPAGWSALVLQTERYTFFFRTPSDVQWCEGNEELTRDYKALEADFEYVQTHIAPPFQGNIIRYCTYMCNIYFEISTL